MIQNIIFDFDDTLFCTNELGKKTLKLLCKKMKLPFDEKKYSTMKGLSRKDRLKKLFPNQYKYMWKKWDLEYKKAFKKEVKPIDKDTIPTLKTLSKKYTLFIFSTKQDFLIKIALRKYNILRLFKQIVGSENVKNKKPHKEGFNKILKQNQIDKNEIILVGDSQIDIKTAQNCNIPLIILSKQKIRAKKVNQITNITEIEKAIKKFEPQKQSQFKILITFRHKHWNGQAGCVLRLANELRKVGHKIEFICPKSSAFAKKAIQLKFSIAGFIELNIKPKNKGFNKQKNKLKKIILT
ncbi:MAG: HAD-IA family hydrolase, partial [archaeon]